MNRLSLQDPKLTAYALGELHGAERDAIEAALREDPAAQAYVDEVRAFGQQLSAALATEPFPGVDGVSATAATHKAGEHAAAGSAPLPEYEKQPGKILRFPQLYFVIGGVAAAGVALMVALWPTVPPAEQKYYAEVSLGSQAVNMPKATSAEMAAERGSSETAAARQDMALPAPTAADLAMGPAATPLPAATAHRVPRVQQGVLAQRRYRAALAEKRIAMAESVLASARRADVVSTSPSTGAATRAAKNDETVVLSPFEVSPVETRRNLAASRTEDSAAAIMKDQVEAARRRGTPVSEPAAVEGLSAGNAKSSSLAETVELPSVVPPKPSDEGFTKIADAPQSEFAVDIDPASYADVRRYIDTGRLPPADSVRTEELINYFPYHYAAPTNGAPLAVSAEVADAPWAPSHRLVRIGLKARDVVAATRVPASLVFVIDASGSMDAPNKLALVKDALRLLVARLQPDDRVCIVTYAANAKLVLPPTPADKTKEILAGLNSIAAEGATNVTAGLQLAFATAKANRVNGGINRVILCTDGDFNIGPSHQGELNRLLEANANSGVALSVLGFGLGDDRDPSLQAVAQRGEGTYGYIDTRRDAEKLLVEQVNGTLLTVAKDVKVQVEFNPARVASYRLIGYDDRDEGADIGDAVPGGELGAGEAVTALYEVVLTAGGQAPAAESANANELLTATVRYADARTGAVRDIEVPVVDPGTRFADASADFKFAAAVASYAMILRDSPERGDATMREVVAWAAAGAAKAADDPHGYRTEFVDLARRTQALME